MPPSRSLHDHRRELAAAAFQRRRADRERPCSILPACRPARLSLAALSGAARNLSRRCTTIDPRRDIGQRQRPVDRRIAAAGDDDALAAEILAPLDQVEDALAFIVGEARERRAVGPERADAGGDDDRAGAQHRPGRGRQRSSRRRSRASVSTRWSEVVDRGEGRGLLARAGRSAPWRRSAGSRGCRRSASPDRAPRTARRPTSSASTTWQRMLEHAAFEDGEQPDRAGADDRDVAAGNRHACSRTGWPAWPPGAA